jgi:WD40 repeat protein
MEFRDTLELVPSADGRHVLARRKSGALERWDLDTLTMESVSSGSHAVGRGLAISDDGERVAAGAADGTLLVWTDPGSAPAVLWRGAGSVASIAFSHDGARVAAVWEHPFGGPESAHRPNRLRAWDISAGRQLIDVAVDPAEVAFDGTGRRVLVAGGSWAQSLERRRDEEMARVEGPPCNSDTLDTLQVWDLDSGRKKMGVRKQCAHAAAFTSDDAFVVADSWETPVVMYAVEDGGVVRRSDGMPVVTSLAVSPDGSRIAVGTGESQIVVLDARSLEALLVIRVENQATTAVVFSADGTRLIATGLGSMVQVYDTRPPHEPGATPKTGLQ